ncbi:hypothetical protein [Pseudopedobacter beijingensis]|uniref:Uncharacterized protein n=1 Tax=Pseudopedobacter beijingensis TaxID=1207056 RepID=A0ABW4I8Q7_9SPHI
METLIISIPENKSGLVKQLLKELGVTMKTTTSGKVSNYKQKLTEVAVWNEKDLDSLKDGHKAFSDLKSEQW